MATVAEPKTGTNLERLPPLASGDRLARDEFERRYAAMPEHVKAELIDGVVYLMPSPVSQPYHGSPQLRLAFWLGFYETMTPGVEAGVDATVRLDDESEPQPDGLLRILPERRGQTVDEDTYIRGAPELVAEIAASTASYDLHAKLHAYQRGGVREYIVWRTWDNQLDWFVLRDGQFGRLSPDADGIYKSTVFPGLWLDAAALLAGDRRRVYEVAQQGIGAPEHHQFVAKLAATTV